MSKIENFKMYIDGEWEDSSSGKKIETLNPENNEVWATVPEANDKDVDKAVQSAQKAFENNWSKLHPRDRAKYLRLIAIKQGLFLSPSCRIRTLLNIFLYQTNL